MEPLLHVQRQTSNKHLFLHSGINENFLQQTYRHRKSISEKLSA